MAFPAFDIFRAEADGSVLWRESAETIDEARRRAAELAAAAPGEYFILSVHTGKRLTVGRDEEVPGAALALGPGA